MQKFLFILIVSLFSICALSAQTIEPLVRAATGISPVDYYDLSLKAQNSYQEKDFKAAAGFYEQLTAAYPWNSDHWYKLGRARYENGQFAAAAEAFVKADEIGVSSANRSNAAYAARAYAQAGQANQALDWLEKAILIYRTDLETDVLKEKVFDDLREQRRFRKLAAPQVKDSISRVDGWRADVDYLLSQINRYRSGAEGKYSSPRLAKMGANLKKRILQLTDVQIAVEIQKIIAFLEQPHNEISIYPGNPGRFSFPGRFPFWVSLDPNGVYITSATEEFSALKGTRIVAINNRPIEQVLAAIRSYIAAGDIPAAGTRVDTISYLTLPHVLQSAGITDRTDKIKLTVIGSEIGAQLRTVEVSSVEKATLSGFSLPNKPPLVLSRFSESFWFEPLPEARALYVNLKSVSDKPDETLAAFGQRLHRYLGEHPEIENLIVDARYNTGGNSYLYTELLRSVVAFDATVTHRTFMIIGRYTGSAAMNFMVDADRLTNAVFVGEPTRSGTQVQDGATFVLPYSGLPFFLATANWHLAGPRDNRRWIAPDIPVLRTIEDTLASRDPVLDTVLQIINRNTAGKVGPSASL